MLDYRLHVFRSVAEQKSITGASRTLHISQPAITKHIQHLEEELGSTLFLRSSSGISLTDAGDILLDHVQRMDDMHNVVLQKLGQTQGTLRGSLRIGASTTISQYYLPCILSSFFHKYPEVKLSLIDGNAEEMIGALLAHKIDLGLIEGPCKRNDIKATPFFDDEIICVVGKKHPLSTKKTVAPSQLPHYPIIERELGSGTRFYVEQALRRAGVKIEKLSVLMDIPRSEAIKGVLKTGVGLSFLSRLSVAAELKTGELLEIKVKGLKISRHFLALHHQGPTPAGAAGVFLNSLSTQSIT